MAKVGAVLTKQQTDIGPQINEVAGEHASHYLGVLIAESNLDELAFRDGTWPDYSAGLSQVIAANLRFGTYAVRPGETSLAVYRQYMFDPANAVIEGWRYYQPMLVKHGDPLWAALGYNRGPNRSTQELEEQVANDPAVARKLERYRQSLKKAEEYAEMAEARFVVGEGVLAAMEEAEDEPRSDENYVRTGISETYGKKAIYYYYAEDNETRKTPFA